MVSCQEILFELGYRVVELFVYTLFTLYLLTFDPIFEIAKLYSFVLVEACWIAWSFYLILSLDGFIKIRPLKNQFYQVAFLANITVLVTKSEINVLVVTLLLGLFDLMMIPVSPKRRMTRRLRSRSFFHDSMDFDTSCSEPLNEDVNENVALETSNSESESS